QLRSPRQPGGALDFPLLPFEGVQLRRQFGDGAAADVLPDDAAVDLPNAVVEASVPAHRLCYLQANAPLPVYPHGAGGGPVAGSAPCCAASLRRSLSGTTVAPAVCETPGSSFWRMVNALSMTSLPAASITSPIWGQSWRSLHSSRSS